MKKTVIVTGSSSGIGREIAISFGALGYNVVINYKTNSKGAYQTAKDIPSAYVCNADVTSELEVRNMFDRCMHRFGMPDILICNAGISNSTRDTPQGTSLMNAEVDFFKEVLDVNVVGAMLCCREFVRSYRGAKTDYKRKIVIISSVRQDILLPLYREYNASKAGVAMLMKNIALELAVQNINVNCVAPGMTLTEMYKDAKNDENVRKKYEEKIPLGKFAETKDIADAVLFLASDKADYIHGTTLTVDGGLSLRTGQ